MTADNKRNKQTLGQGAVSGMPRLLGDRLCFDYINTLEKYHRDGPWEFLPGYDELALWGQHVRRFSPAAVADARQWGEAHPAAATALYRQGMDLRACLTRIFTAIAKDEDPSPADLHQLQAAHWQPEVILTRPPGAEHFAWNWTQPDRLVENLLWQVASSAVETLTTDDLGRIKECRGGADDCGSIFYDSSRNGSRRWCSMEGCGSRAKMRRHYARSRSNPA